MSRQPTIRPATAADVAARAGVSRATVSHIFNGRQDKFPTATREKVHRAAAELSYRPWSAGRSLVTGRGDTIVVVMPRTSIGGMPVQEALERLTADTAGPASNVVLRFADVDQETTVRSLLKMRPLAVVNLGSLDAQAQSELESNGIPTVPKVTHTADGEEYHGAIARLQLRELVQRGPRQIVYAAICDQREDTYGPVRFAAIERVCAEWGLPAPLWCPVPFEVDGAAEALARLPRHEPLGVAAYNDHVALATLAAARRLKIRVPAHLAVIGADDIDVASLWCPPLSSVAIDVARVIDSAVLQLEASLQGIDLPPRDEHETALRVVVRRTT